MFAEIMPMISISVVGHGFGEQNRTSDPYAALQATRNTPAYSGIGDLFTNLGFLL